MIHAGTLLADGKFNEERYTAALRELYTRGSLRFPDGSVSTACEHMARTEHTLSGMKSTTSGYLSISIPFALAYPAISPEGLNVLSKVLFGTVSVLGYPWSSMDPVIIALPISAITITLLQFGKSRSVPETQPS